MRTEPIAYEKYLVSQTNKIIENNPSMRVAPEAKSNNLNILQLQNNFIANNTAKSVADQINKTNEQQQQQLITDKQQHTKKNVQQK